MPIITLEGPTIADMDVRRKLVAEITASAAEAYGMPPEKIIVLLHETRTDQVSVGGQLISDRT